MTNLPKSAGKTFCSQLWYAVKQTTKKEFRESLGSIGNGILENVSSFLMEKIPEKLLESWNLR
jgi:hypothetical protein